MPDADPKLLESILAWAESTADLHDQQMAHYGGKAMSEKKKPWEETWYADETVVKSKERPFVAVLTTPLPAYVGDLPAIYLQAAQLAAAAPELYRALEAIAAWLHEMPPTVQGREKYELARDALRKARGE
jgi:hypothetical protein